jgi:excisionase family DNA binding protein
MITTAFSNSLIPSEADIDLARESTRLWDKLSAKERSTVEIQIGGQSVPLSPGVAQLIADALHEVAAGKPLAMVPLEEELSPNEVAELLNVSRNFVIKLIDRQELPARMVGTHHRIRLVDALAYKQQNDAGRRKTLAKLVSEAQELNMGY